MPPLQNNPTYKEWKQIKDEEGVAPANAFIENKRRKVWAKNDKEFRDALMFRNIRLFRYLNILFYIAGGYIIYKFIR